MRVDGARWSNLTLGLLFLLMLQLRLQLLQCQDIFLELCLQSNILTFFAFQVVLQPFVVDSEPLIALTDNDVHFLRCEGLVDFFLE